MRATASLSHLLMLLFIAPIIQAKNLGNVGPVYPIGEINMLDWIHARLASYAQNGQLEAMQTALKATVAEQVKRPQSSHQLTTTVQPRSFYVDPTLTLGIDVKDNQGNVIYPKGLKINPLDKRTWVNGRGLIDINYAHTLIFIDGDDQRQIAWLAAYQTRKPVKIILTTGSPAEVEASIKTRVYFDQKGTLVNAFQLVHLPSLVNQQGMKWRIDEVNLAAPSLFLNEVTP